MTVDNTAPLHLPSKVNDLKQKVDLPRMPSVNRAELVENGHWSFPNRMFAGKQIGFIYGIRNRHNGKAYLDRRSGEGSSQDTHGD